MIVIKLKNAQGSFMRNVYCLPEFQPYFILQCAAKPWFEMPLNEPVELRSRVFEYFDREGRFYVFKEVPTPARST